MVLVSRTCGLYWDIIVKSSVAFGALTGILEVANIGIEKRNPFPRLGLALRT